MKPIGPSDHAYGCDAFGHLASPFVDGELPRGEHARFTSHLDNCRACQRLTAEYRAIDVVARTPIPEPTDLRWDRAWTVIQGSIASDRAATAASPLASVLSWRPRAAGTLPAFARPLGWAAAAAVLVVALLALQRDRTHPALVVPPPAALRLASNRPAEVLSLACKSPEYVPVVYSTGGDDPFTVIQCALVGSDT